MSTFGVIQTAWDAVFWRYVSRCPGTECLHPPRNAAYLTGFVESVAVPRIGSMCQHRLRNSYVAVLLRRSRPVERIRPREAS